MTSPSTIEGSAHALRCEMQAVEARLGIALERSLRRVFEAQTRAMVIVLVAWYGLSCATVVLAVALR